MITQDEIIEIGKFLKPHGLKGELNAVCDLDDEFFTGDYPLVVEMDGIFVPFFPESVRPKGKEAILIKLEGVDSADDARPFVNKAIWAKRDDVVEFAGDSDLLLSDEFEGYAITDKKRGPVGVVQSVDDSTANVLFVVERPDGAVVYIPVAEEFILEVDDETKTISMNLPEGLLDM